MHPFTLKHPFTTPAGARIESVTVRRPKVKDQKGLQQYGPEQEDQELGLISRVCGLPPEDLGEMDMEDFRAIQEFLRRCVDGEGTAGNSGAGGEVVSHAAIGNGAHDHG